MAKVEKPVCSGTRDPIALLVQAGIDPKANVPLYICRACGKPTKEMAHTKQLAKHSPGSEATRLQGVEFYRRHAAVASQDGS